MEIFCPPSFAQRGIGTAVDRDWPAHCRFCYDLVVSSRPGLLVAVGRPVQEPYFACCQAVRDNDIDAVCYAFGPADADQWSTEVKQRNREHYRTFSYLLSLHHDIARQQFEDATIDVLYLDDLHVQDDTQADLLHWFAKVRPGGVLLVEEHPREERRRTGVFELCQQFHAQHVLLEFEHDVSVRVIRKAGGERPGESEFLRIVFNPVNQESLCQLYFLARETDQLQRKYVQSDFARSIRNQIGIRKVVA